VACDEIEVMCCRGAVPEKGEKYKLRLGRNRREMVEDLLNGTTRWLQHDLLRK